MTEIVEKCAYILVMKNKGNNTANKLEKPNIVNGGSLVRPAEYIQTSWRSIPNVVNGGSLVRPAGYIQTAIKAYLMLLMEDH